MQTVFRLAAAMPLLLLLPVAPATAQSSVDEAAVWSVIEQQWRAEKRGDNRWVEDLLTGDFVGWPKESPAPRNKTSTRLWNEFNSRRTKLLEFELYPQSIVIHGDMAVVHYLYTTAIEERGGDVDTSNGRYTDILVRDDGAWKFVAWHGGDDD